MTDESSIFNLGNLKTAFDIGKSLVSLARQAESKGLDARYAADLNGKIADMQFALIDAQSDALASQEAQSKQSAKIRELEQAIAEFECWEAEKERYRLVNARMGAGTFVFLLRHEAAQEDEPPHYICPRCYHNKVKSILVLSSTNGYTLRCLECKASMGVDVSLIQKHGVIS